MLDQMPRPERACLQEPRTLMMAENIQMLNYRELSSEEAADFLLETRMRK